MRNIGIALALIFIYQASWLPNPAIGGFRMYQFALIVAVLALFTLEGADNRSIGNTRFMPMTLLFLLLTLPSVFCSDSPEHSAPRWLGFAMLLTLIGPLVVTPRMMVLREAAWRALTSVAVVLASASFVWWVLRLPNMGRPGMFCGLFNHSMVLGPVSAFATLVLMAPMLEQRGLQPRRTLMALMSAAACVLAASRSALLALCLGFMAMVLLSRRGRRMDFVLLWFTPAVLLASIVAISPAKVDAPERVYERVIRRGISTSSRDALWAARIREFEKSPVVGVGFQVTEAEGFAPGSSIEPGSSYLVLASSTGLVGVLGFVLLVGSYIPVLRDQRFRGHPQAPLLLGTATLFLTHQAFEGYIFSVGQLLNFIFWLTLGRILDLCYLQREAPRLLLLPTPQEPPG